MQKQLGDNQTLVGVGVHWFTVQTRCGWRFCRQMRAAIHCSDLLCTCLWQWSISSTFYNATSVPSAEWQVFSSIMREGWQGGKSNTNLVWIFCLWWKIQHGSRLDFPLMENPTRIWSGISISVFKWDRFWHLLHTHYSPCVLYSPESPNVERRWKIQQENPTRISSGFSVFDGKSNTDLVWIFHHFDVSKRWFFSLFCNETSVLIAKWGCVFMILGWSGVSWRFNQALVWVLWQCWCVWIVLLFIILQWDKCANCKIDEILPIE